MKAWNSTLSAAKKSMKRSKLRVAGVSDTAKTKKRIQVLLREIVMKRDKGCILRDFRCHTLMGTPGIVWQADHLISRGNSATYGDSRLVVLICKSCHAWKSLGSNLRKAEYDRLVRSILPQERVNLWDMAELQAGRLQGVKMDWRLIELGLEQELKRL